MSTAPLLPGRIGWVDLTVDDASRVRAFYEQVTGWTAQGLSMGDYDDWVMSAADGTAQAGICHARGANTGIPAQWLVYITVSDLEASLAQVAQHGGRVVQPTRTAGASGRFAIIEDPAGAVCALFEAASPAAPLS
jgi:predicted enzyme related to lactoylglutathione lyase